MPKTLNPLPPFLFPCPVIAFGLGEAFLFCPGLALGFVLKRGGALNGRI